jgi:hypothetical protein
MKNHKTAGARPVRFDGKFIGDTEKTCRELGAMAKQARQGHAAAPLLCQSNGGNN